MFTESYNVRAGKDLWDHPVLPSHFIDVGTETWGNKGACPSHWAVSELLRLEHRSLFSHFVYFHFSAFPKRMSEVFFKLIN